MAQCCYLLDIYSLFLSSSFCSTVKVRCFLLTANKIGIEKKIKNGQVQSLEYRCFFFFFHTPVFMADWYRQGWVGVGTRPPSSVKHNWLLFVRALKGLILQFYNVSLFLSSSILMTRREAQGVKSMCTHTSVLTWVFIAAGLYCCVASPNTTLSDVSETLFSTGQTAESWIPPMAIMTNDA